jgi:hypothetical protein
MLTYISAVVAIACILTGLVQAFGSKYDLIARRPYNNPYSDATAARDGRLPG